MRFLSIFSSMGSHDVVCSMSLPIHAPKGIYFPLLYHAFTVGLGAYCITSRSEYLSSFERYTVVSSAYMLTFTWSTMPGMRSNNRHDRGSPWRTPLVTLKGFLLCR